MPDEMEAAYNVSAPSSRARAPMSCIDVCENAPSLIDTGTECCDEQCGSNMS
jgi:hypothetical protein